MLLAGDVGGSKTLLGLYAAGAAVPRAHAVRRFPTLAFGGLPEMVTAFLDAVGWTEPPEAACFGVAGPVRGQAARLTNAPWGVDARRVAAQLAIPQVALLNDLAALAQAVPALTRDQLAVIQRGDPDADGNAAVIAPGTGLGEALLHRLGGRFVPAPSEAGHADFAARTARETALAQALTARFGRASYEQVPLGSRPRQHPPVRARGTPPAARRPRTPPRPIGRRASPGPESNAAARAAWKRSSCSSAPSAPRPATSASAR